MHGYIMLGTLHRFSACWLGDFSRSRASIQTGWKEAGVVSRNSDGTARFAEVQQSILFIIEASESVYEECRHSTSKRGQACSLKPSHMLPRLCVMHATNDLCSTSQNWYEYMA